LNILHEKFHPSVPSTWIRHVWSGSYVPGEEKDQFFANVRNIQQLQIFGKNVPFTRSDGKIRQIGPALVHMPLETSVGKLYVIEAVTPIAPLMQRVEHVIYGPRFPIYRPICKLLMMAFSKQFVRGKKTLNILTCQTFTYGTTRNSSLTQC
jgi:hypothetical protein